MKKYRNGAMDFQQNISIFEWMKKIKEKGHMRKN